MPDLKLNEEIKETLFICNVWKLTLTFENRQRIPLRKERKRKRNIWYFKIKFLKPAANILTLRIWIICFFLLSFIFQSSIDINFFTDCTNWSLEWGTWYQLLLIIISNDIYPAIGSTQTVLLLQRYKSCPSHLCPCSSRSVFMHTCIVRASLSLSMEN